MATNSPETEKRQSFAFCPRGGGVLKCWRGGGTAPPKPPAFACSRSWTASSGRAKTRSICFCAAFRADSDRFCGPPPSESLRVPAHAVKAPRRNRQLDRRRK